MKNVSKIFVWAFILLSLLPLFEFFLFQWRNDSRISISTQSSLLSLDPSAQIIIYTVPDSPNSLTDFILHEMSYGVVEQVDFGLKYNARGFSRTIFFSIHTVIRAFPSSSSFTYTRGTFLLNLFSVCLFLQRSVYIAIATFLLYLLTLPVLLVTNAFRRKT